MEIKKSLKGVAFVLLGTLSFDITADADTTKAELPTIYWLFFDFPPAVDFHNRARPGSIVEMHRILVEKMPEYKHQVVDIPASAAFQQMKMKKGSCSLIFLKSAEREEFMKFGSPLLQGEAAGVYIRKDNAKLKKYLEDGENSKVLNLDEMLKDKSVRLGVQYGRFYGKKINESLGVRKGAGIITKQGINGDKEFKAMLHLGRIDAFFGYSSQCKSNLNLEFFHVKDNYEFLDPRVSCEKSAFGDEVIAKTQEARRKYRLDSEFAKIHKKYQLNADQ